MPPSKGPSILIGALVLALVSVLSSVVIGPTGALAQTVGCLTLLLAPIIAVAHYTSTHRLTLKAGQGAGIGASAALLGMVISFAVGYVLQELGITPSFEEITEMEMARQREALEARGMSREEIDDALALGASMSSPLIGFAFVSLLSLIVGAVAGAISALVFKKGEAA